MPDPPEFVGIIPARFESTRFPGKPLADILGRPMMWHVYTRASRCPLLSKVVLATDHERIASEAARLNMACVMTSKDHLSGTDRIFEAARLLNLPDQTVVANIQGDEPALEPDMLISLLKPFADPSVQVSTLARTITRKEAENPDQVKVVIGANSQALYFSRSRIPFDREADSPDQFLGHIGLYAFRMPALRRFTELPPSALEKRESLEQLRLLENGLPIHVARTEYRSQGVDRPEDIALVEKLIKASTG